MKAVKQVTERGYAHLSSEQSGRIVDRLSGLKLVGNESAEVVRIPRNLDTQSTAN